MHNPRQNKYWKSFNTPVGQVRLQFATKGRKDKFWRMVWSTKTEQVTTHYRQVKGGWNIEFYLTRGPDVKPGINAITHQSTSKKYLNLQEAVMASVAFLDKTFPNRVNSADFSQQATRARRILEKWSDSDEAKLAAIEEEMEEMRKKIDDEKNKPPPMERKDAPWRF